MVVIQNEYNGDHFGSYSTSNQIFIRSTINNDQNNDNNNENRSYIKYRPTNTLIHQIQDNDNNRYYSDKTPQIKEIPRSNSKKVIKHERKPSNQLFRHPTILSTLNELSPKNSINLQNRSNGSINRKISIKRTKRSMFNKFEIKTKFFYPKNNINSNIKRGKYRNLKELNSNLNYINIDSSMSKELVLNQFIQSFQISNKELIKFNPILNKSFKSITVDSKNNYILYTPISTGKNSIISKFENHINNELIKLGVSTNTTTTTNSNSNSNFTEIKSKFRNSITLPQNSYQNNYKDSKLFRTNSLPINFKAKRTENYIKLWNLYYKRVITNRIKFRLQNHLGNDSNYNDCSSISTEFFLNASLQSNNSNNTKNFYNQRKKNSNDNIIDSLDDLMMEMNSIVSSL